MRNIGIIFSLAMLSASCGPKENPGMQGKTEQEEISVVGKIPGRIEVLKVSEGDSVKKGDTLAILSVPEVDAKKAQAAGAVEAAEAQYNMSVAGATKNQLIQLQSKQAALQEQYDYAEKSVGRLQNMVKDSLIPQQQFDEAYAKFQGAKAQLAAVKAEIADVEHGVRMEQQQMALGQKNRALGALQEATTAENERFIIAPADMIINTITLKVGELALPGYTLFKGNLPNTTYFRFTLPENDLNKVKKGMEVQVHVVYKNQTIDGIITHIKQLPAYANIATAYPDYEIQQSLFEIQVSPKNQDEVTDLFPKTTVTLKL
ncbi:MAG TPA: HlyD family efflux transporter periplasmic adaptor subunit [Flavobacteriaceae bacterium]|nr:HlyD family efflux transporter periplasmic adaptor subunit [Flavobacteriaceae bacterium]